MWSESFPCLRCAMTDNWSVVSNFFWISVSFIKRRRNSEGLAFPILELAIFDQKLNERSIQSCLQLSQIVVHLGGSPKTLSKQGYVIGQFAMSSSIITSDWTIHRGRACRCQQFQRLCCQALVFWISGLLIWRKNWHRNHQIDFTERPQEQLSASHTNVACSFSGIFWSYFPSSLHFLLQIQLWRCYLNFLLVSSG